MTQRDLFDFGLAEPLASPAPPANRTEASADHEGERLKRIGMDRAAMSKDTLLGYARGLAVDLARENGGLCHADMVAEALAKEGRPPLGDAAGSLWLKHVWEFSGNYHLSERPASHRNRLMVWRLKHQ